MGVKLVAADEYVHQPGKQINWNESRYVDFYDSRQGLGGWLRIGVRPVASYAELAACVYLPDGGVACFFERPQVHGNQLSAGGQEWEVVTPFVTNRVRYRGQVMLLPDGWSLTNPGPVFRSAPRESCAIDLTVTTLGQHAVMGADQAHIDRIFLPGQADFHYQHLAWSSGTIRIGAESWRLDGGGGKDHSWGPRNWHAKTYMRWFTAVFDDGSGFMLMRAVGPTKQTRGGHVWSGGRFHLVDDFTMKNAYGNGPRFRPTSVDVSFRAAGKDWSAQGFPQAWLPLRHRQPRADGQEDTLRIVKSPARWTRSDGMSGTGACEFHDLMINGVPAGLHD